MCAWESPLHMVWRVADCGVVLQPLIAGCARERVLTGCDRAQRAARVADGPRTGGTVSGSREARGRWRGARRQTFEIDPCVVTNAGEAGGNAVHHLRSGGAAAAAEAACAGEGCCDGVAADGQRRS